MDSKPHRVSVFGVLLPPSSPDGVGNRRCLSWDGVPGGPIELGPSFLGNRLRLILKDPRQTFHSLVRKSGDNWGSTCFYPFTEGGPDLMVKGPSGSLGEPVGWNERSTILGGEGVCPVRVTGETTIRSFVLRHYTCCLFP